MVLKQADIFGGSKAVCKKRINNNALCSEGNSLKNKSSGEKLKDKICILYKLYEQLYEQQNIIIDSRDVIVKGNIIIYPEDRQAEPINSVSLSMCDIDKRIKIMQEVLNIK